mgnify:CR=1 FL=1|jgi:hypothetical protein
MTFKQIIPKSHGAWAMFMVPYLMGLFTLEQISIESILVFPLMLSLFFMHNSIFIYYKKKNKPESKGFFKVGIISLVISTLIGTYILYLSFNLHLIYLGLIVSILLAIHTYLISNKKEMSIFGELLGIAGLTLGGTAVHVIFAGSITSLSLLLWFVNILYFGSTVFFVKLKLRTHPKIKKPMNQKEKLNIGFLALLAGLIPFIIFPMMGIYRYAYPFSFALIKILLGVFMWNPGEKLKPIQIGIVESVLSIIFLIWAIIVI